MTFLVVACGLVSSLLVQGPVAPVAASTPPTSAVAGASTGGVVAASTSPDRMTVRPSRVYVVGDSITYRSRKQLLKRRPGWDVDGVSGRNVRTLPMLLTARMQMKPKPRHVVVALGANGHESWGKQDYIDAVGLLPRKTRVTFTTMWRNPEVWGPGVPQRGKRSTLMRQYTRYVQQIARQRPRTCVFKWHRRASRRPRQLILADGVHPTVRGKKVWARGVSRTVKKCANQR